jgi:hypothetical protein
MLANIVFHKSAATKKLNIKAEYSASILAQIFGQAATPVPRVTNSPNYAHVERGEAQRGADLMSRAWGGLLMYGESATGAQQILNPRAI